MTESTGIAQSKKNIDLLRREGVSLAEVLASEMEEYEVFCFSDIFVKNQILFFLRVLNFRRGNLGILILVSNF